MSRTGSGIGIHRSREISCSMIAGGKIAASDCGLTGLPSPPSSGAGGCGISATTLYQCAGMSDSSSRILTWPIRAKYQERASEQTLRSGRERDHLSLRDLFEVPNHIDEAGAEALGRKLLASRLDEAAEGFFASAIENRRGDLFRGFAGVIEGQLRAVADDFHGPA